jgi:hypothetical protein
VTALPARVDAVCRTFLDASPAGLVTGLYLHGGLAFGEWIEGKSDLERGHDVAAFAANVVGEGVVSRRRWRASSTTAGRAGAPTQPPPRRADRASSITAGRCRRGSSTIGGG